MTVAPNPDGLIVQELACRRGERVLFSDLSFALQPGEVLIVRGPNGAGKSSLLRVLAGLLPADGEVRLAGLSVDDDAPAYHRQLAWLGHLDGLQANETAREAIALRGQLWGCKDSELALAIAPFADREARYLSAGQKRRAALAGVIATGARLWLLDEPTVGLDADSVGLFRAALQRHLAAGGMAVVVTHEGEWEGGQSLNLENHQQKPSPPQGGEGNAALAERSAAISGVGEGDSEDRYQVSEVRMGRVLLTSDSCPLTSESQPRLSSCVAKAWQPSPMRARVFPILQRELRLSLRQGGQLLTSILFFILVIMLLAFGVGPDPQLLQSIAPGAIWVAALLSCLLSLERVFGSDFESGALDQLQASPLSGETLALAKMLAHWLTSGLPLTLASVAAGLLLHLPLAAVFAMLASLALGTPVLSLIGGAIAALLLGARRGSLILTLLLLPLYIPTLIFGAASIQKALAGGSYLGPLSFLAALLALALPLAPLAAAAALEE
jgi:heme exporter protein B